MYKEQLRSKHLKLNINWEQPKQDLAIIRSLLISLQAQRSLARSRHKLINNRKLSAKVIIYYIFKHDKDIRRNSNAVDFETPFAIGNGPEKRQSRFCNPLSSVTS